MLKRQRSKTVITALLIIVMFISMAGCGTGSTSSTTTGATTGTTSPNSEATTTQAEPQDGPMVKYKEPVTITVFNVTSASYTYIEGDSEDDNIHTRMNKEYLNIIYKSKWVVDESKLDEKINLSIASDDLPDAMSVNASQLQNVIKNDQVQSLDEVWKTYPTPELRANEEYQNKVAFLPSTKDGVIYGLPLTGDYGESIPVMYVRKDWLEKLKLTAPKTIDELVAVSKAFVEDDPDGNNVKDTYAIELDNRFGRTTLESIAAAYGAYYQSWIKDSTGKIVYGSVQPEMKTALAKMQELYLMGAFDPEFAIKDSSKAVEAVTAGKIGIYFGIYSGAIDPLLQNKMNEPNVDWDVLPIPTVSSDDVIVPPAKPFTQRWVVVRKGYEHPEAVIKSMNLWFSTNYNANSPENKEWVAANGAEGKYNGRLAQVYAKPYYFMKVDGNSTISKNLIKYNETKDKALYDQVSGFLDLIEKKDALGWAIGKVFYESVVVVSNYKTLKYPDYLGAPTTTQLSKGSSLDKLEAEAFVQIIMGAPISEFDIFVEKWHKLGGDTIAEEINANMN